VGLEGSLVGRAIGKVRESRFALRDADDVEREGRVGKPSSECLGQGLASTSNGVERSSRGGVSSGFVVKSGMADTADDVVEDSVDVLARKEEMAVVAVVAVPVCFVANMSSSAEARSVAAGARHRISWATILLLL
jgi:hypothetical protein